MSVHVISAVLNCRDPELSSARRMVLVSIGNYADDGGHSWPSQETIGDECGIKRRALIDHLKWLEENGFLNRSTKRLGKGNGCRTSYRISLERLRVNCAENAPVTADRSADIARAETAPLSDRSAVFRAYRCGIPHVTNRQEPSIDNSLRSLSGADTQTSAIIPFKEKPRAVKREPNPKFAMNHGWQPSAKSLALARDELGMTESELRAAHADFIEYWAGEAKTKHGKKSTDGWNRAFDSNLRKLANWWGSAKRKSATNGRRPSGVVEIARAELQRGSASGDWF